MALIEGLIVSNITRPNVLWKPISGYGSGREIDHQFSCFERPITLQSYGTLPLGPTRAPGWRIEQVSRLRIVVPVPENYFSGTVNGAKVDFTVPAFPGEKFTGRIARIPDSLDVKTRTMPVELDFINSLGRLAPGMYPEVEWPVRRSRSTLFVPTSAIARTNERRFLVAIRDGKAQWVDVQTGTAVDKMTEVFGDLHEGDIVAVRGTDELRPGTVVDAKLAQPK